MEDTNTNGLIYGVMKTAGALDVLKNVVKTVREGGLTGAKGGVESPWAKSLLEARSKDMLKTLGRRFSNVEEVVTPETVKNLLSFEHDPNKMETLLGVLMRPISEGATPLVEREFTGKALEVAKSLPGGIASALFGNKRGYLDFLDRYHKAGLVGKGSHLRELFSPGEQFYNTVSTLKKHVGEHGLKNLGDLPLTGSDYFSLIKGPAKPLLWGGGLLLPAVGTYQALTDKADPTKGKAENLLGGLTGYAGGLMGMPAGMVGYSLASAGGSALGETAGRQLDKLFGSGPDNKMKELEKLRRMQEYARQQRNLNIGVQAANLGANELGLIEPPIPTHLINNYNSQ